MSAALANPRRTRLDTWPSQGRQDSEPQPTGAPLGSAAPASDEEQSAN
ncbi:hypothetical protein [Actinomadura rupiterrae]|nr:hypothetical protein [Actinomadura rupiterrae]MCP2334735.1 hypothetical protein [Actinomadura rupiterrae]